MGGPERELAAGRPDQLAKHGGGQHDGLQRPARFAAQGPRAEGREADGDARLRRVKMPLRGS